MIDGVPENAPLNNLIRPRTKSNEADINQVSQNPKERFYDLPNAFSPDNRHTIALPLTTDKKRSSGQEQ